MPTKNNRAAVFIEAEDRTRAGVESAKRNLGALDESVIGLRSSFMGLLAGVTAGSLIAFVKNAADAQDEVGKLSQKVGVATETLSGWQYAARLSDVSNEQLGVGLKQLAKNMSDTAAGTGEARAAFNALGIEVTDNTGKLRSTDEVFLQLADRFAGMEDGAGKTAIAMKLFGKSGADLLPMLNSGSAGLAEMTAEAERFGLIVQSDAAAAAEIFNDELTKLSSRAEGLGISIANKLMPHLSDLIDEFTDGEKRAGGFWNALRLFGTMNPFSTWDAEARRLNGEIADLERRLPNMKPGAFRDRAQQALADKRIQLGFVYDQMDDPDGGTVVPGIEIPGAEKVAAPTLTNPGAAAAAAAAARKAQQEREWVAKMQAEGEEQFAKDYADAWKFASAAVNKDLAAVQQQEADRWQAVYRMIDEEQEQLYRDGQALLEADRIALEREKEEARKFADLLGPIQNDIESAILAGEGLDNVFAGFGKTLASLAIRKWVTEPIIEAGAELLKLKSASGGGGGGGLLGSLVSNLISGFSFDSPYAGLDYGASDVAGQMFDGSSFVEGFQMPSFDVGTPYVPRDMVAKIHKGERIVPAAMNKPVAGGAGGRAPIIQNHYHIDSRTDRASIIAEIRASERRTVAQVQDMNMRGAWQPV